MTKSGLSSLFCAAFLGLMVATPTIARPVSMPDSLPIGPVPHILPIDPMYHWTLSGPDIGSGSLDESGGNITAFTGTIDSVSVNLLGGNGVQTSPSGAFIYDNILYPNDVSVLDVDGILMTFNGGEANLWGNGAPNNYSFYAFVNGSFPIANAGVDTFSIRAPEPATWALLLASLFGAGAMVRYARRRAMKAA